MILNYEDLGLINYRDALKRQEETLLKVQEGANDTLFLLEHPKVITMGLNAKPENLLFSLETCMAKGYQVEKIKRGGDVTYHGPGQIVGYTICNLKANHQSSIKKYVEGLETVFIQYLKDVYNLDAKRDPANAGVFIGNNKITAIGLSVHKGVTMHGFAFNVNTELSDYEAIVPCGLVDKGVTSLEMALNQTIPLDQVKEDLLGYYKKIFHYT